MMAAATKATIPITTPATIPPIEDELLLLELDLILLSEDIVVPITVPLFSPLVPLLLAVVLVDVTSEVLDVVELVEEGEDVVEVLVVVVAEVVMEEDVVVDEVVVEEVARVGQSLDLESHVELSHK